MSICKVVALLIFPTLALAANYGPITTIHLNGSSEMPYTASQPLARDLASISLETEWFADFVGNARYPQALTSILLDGFKARTGVPAQIRIGGITADSTSYVPSQAEDLDINTRAAFVNQTIGPSFFSSISLFPDETKIIFTLNLKSDNLTLALEEATAVVQHLKPSQLIAFEIGNEVDQYPSSGPLVFTPENYTSLWQNWTATIATSLNLPPAHFQACVTAMDPIYPFDSSAALAQVNCRNTIAAGIDGTGMIGSCAEHTYQWSVCDPTRKALAILPNLMNHIRIARYLDLWIPQINATRNGIGREFNIGEFNSVSCGGVDNVTNTFGQALWLVDTLLYAASLNVSHLYYHIGTSAHYNLWSTVNSTYGPVGVYPAYSAYLLVDELVGFSTTSHIANVYPGRQANLSSLYSDETNGDLAVYALWDTSPGGGYAYAYPTKLAAVNFAMYNQSATDAGAPRPGYMIDFSRWMSPMRYNGCATVRRLTSPGADVKTSNVTTWAGQEFSSGVAKGVLVEERACGGSVIVGASEAVLLVL